MPRIQNHCAKSVTLGFSERTPEVLTNLSHGRFVFCWEWGGDRRIGEANLRKGLAPSMAGAPCARKGVALQWKRHCRPCPASKIIAPNRGSRGLGNERTPEVLMNLSHGRFVFCWEWGGDRSIGEANLRKGLAPSMAGAPCAWLACLAPAPCGDWQRQCACPHKLRCGV